MTERIEIVVGQKWIYKQSLREYRVVEVKDGEVSYTTDIVSPALGRLFVKPVAEFLDKFCKPEWVTPEIREAAIKHTLVGHGLLKEF